MKKGFIALFMVLCMLLCCSAYAADDIDASKKVSKVEVSQLPNKTAYVIGETFSMEGGMLLVSYSDDTTDEIPMTAPSVTVKEPGMKASGTKTVTLKVGGKNARFTISVANNSYAVTYNQNYEGAPEPEQVDTVKGEKAENKVPVRDGYTLVGWYTDPDFTQAFDFSTEITADTALYALWIKDGVEQVNVTFDYDYYGVLLSTYSYPIEAGTTVQRPQNNPERVGYTFNEWVKEDGTTFDFAAPVTADTVIKASWTKTTEGVNSWLFEAEDTNLTGKTGPAISGTANEIGMIQQVEGVGASNDRFVGYMYQIGNTIDFYLAADEDLDDVTIILRLSAEMEDLSLTPAEYGVSINGEYVQYGTIEIKDVPAMDWGSYVAAAAPFQDFVIAQNVHLNKGRNVIKLETLNSIPYTGTTMVAHAPLADCLTIQTTGVVIWDENFGEPATGNYQK